MNVEWSICIWGVLSVFICIYMAKISNAKAEQLKAESENGETRALFYTWNMVSGLLLLGILLVSVLGAYIVWQRAASGIAWVELSIAYIAVLGAAVMDYKLHRIPNAIPFVLIVTRGAILLYELISHTFAPENLLDSICGCMLCFFVLMLADKLFSGGIGKGDIKLLSALGFACGTYTVFSTFLLALISCTLISLVLLCAKKVTLKDHLPFGPFIWAGYLGMILLAY